MSRTLPETSSSGTLLPADIYASQVEALYQDARSLAVGAVAACLTTAGTGILMRDPVIGGIAVALAVLGLVRLALMRRFWACRSGLSDAALRRWERGYVLGGSLHLALLGGFCIAAFTRSDDAFPWIASLSITMAYLIGTPGRSFASNLLVDTQILVSAVPLVASLAIVGQRYWIVIIFVIVPFFLALKTISTRLRGIFQDAVLRARALGIMAERFDTALSNMPHGLAMFADDGRITVANARFGALLDRDPDLHGEAIGDVLKPFRDRHGDPDAGPLPEMRQAAAPRLPERWLGSKRDGSTISFTIQAMAGGGGVIIAEDVTEQVQAQARLAHVARHDKLTGLPNRYGFQDAMARRLEARATAALMFIDLDRFKGVNDTLGHAVGDRLLQAVAERLTTLAGPDALLARFGGDEFVLHAPVADVQVDAARWARRIIAALSEPYDVQGHRIIIGATIGIADAVQAADVESLLRDADLALYSAKAGQKGSYSFFEDTMREAAAKRRALEEDLRGAIAGDQMTLHFQPIVDAVSGRISSCEALLRWKHPTRGFVPPMEFIAIAEETGYIWDLGSWVLQQACLECARWPEHVGIAVNVSALQFQRGDLAEAALRAVITAGLAPHRLEIEITETSLLRTLHEARAQLMRLQHFGFRIALDDFGTGYSSLSYLQQLPFDKVKLDRSFLSETATEGCGSKVLQGVARLCSDLGMSVVMEGVETPGHLALARHIGIAEVQGFLTGRPAAAEAIRPLLPGGIDLDGGRAPPQAANAIYG